ATVNPQSGVEQNFSVPVEYTVTAEDETTSKEYLVTVTLAPNNEALITSFSISGQTGLIDDDAGTISITLPFGTDLTNLTPEINISENATITPLSEDLQEFSYSVTYRVTAEDGVTTNEYLVTVTMAPNDEAHITYFYINDQVSETEIDFENFTISLKMPPGYALNNLTPEIEVSENAEISPASGLPRDFTESVEYIVTSESGDQQVWLVTVTNEISTTISEENSVSIKAFPNPTNGLINVESNLPVQTIRIIAPDGRQMFYQSYSDELSIGINLSDFSSGVYLLKVITTNNQLSILRILVNKN
ncbi:DUF5018 domain-containing protein, partial [Natronoflexus pectinivorans]